jgi:hypothetical protein
MRALVISADGTEPTLPAIQQALDYIGVPYTVWITSQHPGALTADQLASANGVGQFYAVFLATSNLAYTPDGGNTWQSGLTAAEWQVLWSYEAAFKVRQVTLYTFPTPDYGFSTYSAVDTTTKPVSSSLTSAGRIVFPYLSNTAIPISNAYTYLGTVAATSTDVQVLARDASGKALIAVRTYADGRQNLAVTFSGNQYLVHTLAYNYGLVNWATRGIFLGQRQIYMTPQADDYFIADDIWTAATPCGTNLDLNPSGVTYRMNATDVSKLSAWQKARRLQTSTSGLRLSMAFNGSGTVAESAGGDMPAGDTLINATTRYSSDFFWINHTYAHMLLNDTTSSLGETYLAQLTQNDAVATRLRLPNYSKGNLVTPEISGLSNPTFLTKAVAYGIKYVVSDVSRAGMGNPTPNVGYPNALQPSIYTIPRRANNLFYNVSQPAEWVAEYNCLYASYWGKSLTYAQILDKESDMLLQNLLRGDIDPWMFHVTNMRFYDSARTKSLITDLIDATVAKYDKIYKLPMTSLSQDALGKAMQDRSVYNNAGVQGTITGKQITLTASGAATVPITGGCPATATQGITQKTYSGQCIASVPVTAGGQVSFTLP